MNYFYAFLGVYCWGIEPLTLVFTTILLIHLNFVLSINSCLFRSMKRKSSARSVRSHRLSKWNCYVTRWAARWASLAFVLHLPRMPSASFVSSFCTRVTVLFHKILQVIYNAQIWILIFKHRYDGRCTHRERGAEYSTRVIFLFS